MRRPTGAALDGSSLIALEELAQLLCNYELADDILCILSSAWILYKRHIREAMGHIGSPRAAQEKFRISRHTEPWQRAGRLSSAAFDPTFFLAENMESILLLWDRIAEVNCEVITVYPLVWGSSWFTCWFVHPKLGRQRWPIWIANPLWHIWHVSFLGQAGISPFWGKS